MSYNSKTLLKDANGHPIPQYYDASTDSYQPLGYSQNVYTQPLPVKDFAINTLTVAATQIEVKAGVSPLANRKKIMLYPPDTGSVYWGKTGVTVATGVPLTAGQQPLVMDVDSKTPKLFVIGEAETSTAIKVVEFS